ncbi:amidohydrolase [Anaerosphaera multitolerans]|uniref:Amidohydrolase n=1 Tax=Anaerosphaera multitolerans TaxID=2487351 RepID=A0A437S6P4_9FIRM|nr:amidohydrolase [Anaerosphaera multitolerans]RVU54689.1 amidohydrolase [Anaerosphaera multitolerans]
MKKLFYGGKFYLEREKFADAVLVEEDKIIEVGSYKDLEKLDFDEKIDLTGKTILPGLNDSHCHISCVGAAYVQVDLSSCTSIDEIVEVTKKFIRENPKLVEKGIRTMGWNQDLFTSGEKRILNKKDVDRISTEIPIVLERVCGHICAVNSKVLEMKNITIYTEVPRGGTIEFDENNEPTGVFTENAVQWIEQVIPEYTKDEKIDFMVKALKYAQSVGLTSVQSNDVSAPNTYGDFESIRSIYEDNLVDIRYRHQFCAYSGEEMDYILNGEMKKDIYKGTKLKFGPIKMFKDGSLGASTAMMRDGYVNDRNNHGVSALEYDLQEELVAEASKRGFQVVTHVIGDGAIEETIDAYEKSFEDGENKLRHSLVHCQITDMPLLERIAKLDVGVLYQPIFLDYDMHVVEDRVGRELSSTSYAFNTLDKLGAHIGYGTDAPVEDLNPFPNIYAAVTRCDKNGFPEGGFFPEEKVDIYTAIDAYTIGSSYLEFEEDVKGRIKKGYLADFTVIDEDIFEIDPIKIKDIKASMTIIGGKIVYEK